MSKRWKVTTHSVLYHEGGAVMVSTWRFRFMAEIAATIRRFVLPCFETVVEQSP